MIASLGRTDRIGWRQSGVAAWVMALLVGVLARPALGSDLDCVVTISPLKGVVEPLVEAAGGEVEVWVPRGVSPHDWEPTPRKVARFRRADVFVHIGLGMERGVERLLRGGTVPSHVVRFSDVVGATRVGEVFEGAHDHGDHDGHDHSDCDHDHGGENDPHLWLDPHKMKQLVVSVSFAIEDVLTTEGKSERIDAVRLARTEVLARIDEIDEAYKAAMARFDRPIVVAHDAYGHLSKRYGIQTIALAGLDAREVRTGQLASAIKQIREEQAVAVYLEPQMPRRTGEMVAKRVGLPLLELDPLGDGDWFEMMRKNLAALERGFEGGR